MNNTNNKYILIFCYSEILFKEEYYGGATYQYRGEKYARLTSFDYAKRFSSVKRAITAYNKLFESCINVPSHFKICEVQNNGCRTEVYNNNDDSTAVSKGGVAKEATKPLTAFFVGSLDGSYEVVFFSESEKRAFIVNNDIMDLSSSLKSLNGIYFYVSSLDYKMFADCKTIDDFITVTGKDNSFLCNSRREIDENYEYFEEFTPYYDIENWDFEFNVYVEDIHFTPIKIIISDCNFSTANKVLLNMNIPPVAEDSHNWSLCGCEVAAHGVVGDNKTTKK